MGADNWLVAARAAVPHHDLQVFCFHCPVLHVTDGLQQFLEDYGVDRKPSRGVGSVQLPKTLQLWRKSAHKAPKAGIRRSDVLDTDGFLHCLVEGSLQAGLAPKRARQSLHSFQEAAEAARTQSRHESQSSPRLPSQDIGARDLGSPQRIASAAVEL
jgi:hypothetical protein